MEISATFEDISDADSDPENEVEAPPINSWRSMPFEAIPPLNSDHFDFDFELDPEPDSVPDSEPDCKPDPEPDSEPDSEPDPDCEPVSEPAAGADPDPDSKPFSDPEQDSQGRDRATGASRARRVRWRRIFVVGEEVKEWGREGLLDERI